MSVIPIVERRPVPSFAQWLTENGHGGRGDGFKEFIDLAERTLAQSPALLTPLEASFLRLLKGMQVAAIELCQIERKSGRTPHEIVTILPRVMGAVAVYATASIAKDDAPMRTIAKVLFEEFRFSTKEAADQIEASR